MFSNGNSINSAIPIIYSHIPVGKKSLRLSFSTIFLLTFNEQIKCFPQIITQLMTQLITQLMTEEPGVTLYLTV